MLIEFVAIPGSGKSHISIELKKYLQINLHSRDYDIYLGNDLLNINTRSNHPFFSKVERKLKLNFQRFCLLFDFNVLKLLIRILLSKRSIFEKKKVIFFVMDKLRTYRKISYIQSIRSGKSIFIIDEGWLHYSDTILNDKIDEIKLFTYFDLINRIKFFDYESLNKRYLFINSSIIKNIERMKKRHKGYPQLWKKLNEKEITLIMQEQLYNNKQKENYINRTRHEKYTIENNFDEKKYLTVFGRILKDIKGL